ncbi:MAG: hypothetical protein WDW36_002164 [Sanguina aurantia]
MSSNRSGPSGGYSSPPEMDSNFVITLDDVVPAVHDNQNFNQQQAPAYNQAPQYNNQAPAYNQAPGGHNNQAPAYNNQAPAYNNQAPAYNNNNNNNNNGPAYGQAPAYNQGPQHNNNNNNQQQSAYNNNNNNNNNNNQQSAYNNNNNSNQQQSAYNNQQGGPAYSLAPAYSQAPQQQPMRFTDTTANSAGISGKMGQVDDRTHLIGSGPQRSDAPAFASSGSGQPFTGGGAAEGSGGGSPSAKTYEQVEEESAKLAFYNIRRYRPYFNLDTKDAVWRATSSLFGPFRPTFMADTMARPDLYGPFWIATTLVFVTAVAGNFASYIAPPSSSQAQWYNDYGKMSASAAVFYGYVFLVGMALYFILRYFKGDMKLVNVWCIYGYSLTIFIPISLVCVVPVETVRWCAVATATLMSGLFLFMNLRTVIYAAAPARATIMLIVILLLHLALGVGLKLYFFSY